MMEDLGTKEPPVASIVMGNAMIPAVYGPSMFRDGRTKQASSTSAIFTGNKT